MSDRLLDFIHTQTTVDLTSAAERASDVERPGEIILIDDPASLDALRWSAKLAVINAKRRGRAIAVVAFDPLQVEGRRKDELSDEALKQVRDEHEVTRIHLRDCYRQRSDVGRAARNITGVILDSSPFLLAQKQIDWAQGRKEIARDALDLRFINEAGRVVVSEEAGWEDWKAYLSYVVATSVAQRVEGDPANWPVLAVVEPLEAKLPATWEPLLSAVHHERVGGYDWPGRLRGIEYQHVALILTQRELNMVKDGFTGSGRTDYEKFRLLLIPFSRARESLAVFALPQR